jgi:hypothetical protein
MRFKMNSALEYRMLTDSKTGTLGWASNVEALDILRFAGRIEGQYVDLGSAR